MPSDNEIEAEVRRALQDTRVEPTSLVKLEGGSVNWIFVATLSTPLEDGSSQVLIKSGQKKMASKPEFDLPLLRCVSADDKMAVPLFSVTCCLEDLVLTQKNTGDRSRGIAHTIRQARHEPRGP